MSDGISAHGTIIAWQATPGGAFTEIAELAGDIVPPGLSRNDIETTTHNDDIDSFVQGVLRRGEATFTLNFLKTNAGHNATTGLVHAIVTNLKTGFKFTFPDTAVWIFSGGVKTFNMKAPVDGALQAEVALRPTGRMILDDIEIGG
jgi:hypothetical protein